MYSILITGATGYLGSNLLNYLLSKNYSEIIILKRKSSRLNRIESVIDKIKIFDIEDGLDNVFKSHKIDVLINLAAIYGKKGESLSEIINTNLQFPVKLIENAINYNVKFFIQSSSSLPHSINPYSLSKYQFENWLFYFKDKIKVVNLKLEYFYGKNDDEWKFIPMLINKMKNNENQIKLTSGKQKRDFIYVKDAVNAMEIIIENIEKIQTNTIIPIGTGTSISLYDLAYLIKNKLNNTNTFLNFGAIPDRENELNEIKADISFLKNLGWEPTYTLEQGIIKTIE